MARVISQREARRLDKRVTELVQVLEGQRRTWASEWPGGAHLYTITPSEGLKATVDTARRLRHAVVCVLNNGELRFYGLPLPQSK